MQYKNGRFGRQERDGLSSVDAAAIAFAIAGNVA